MRINVPTILALAVFLTASCGSGDSLRRPTVRPEATATPAITDAPDVRSDAIAAFETWIEALAEGETDRAWNLIAPTSQRAVGGLENFRQLRTDFAEGWGSWVAVENASYAIKEDEAGRTLLIVQGDIRPEGRLEHREVGIPIVRNDVGDVILSPFEEFGNVARGLEQMPDEDPPSPANSGSGRRIVYANAAQRVWLIAADGALVDTYLVSGKRGVPAPGTYEVFSKSRFAFAGHDGITMRHMVRFAHGKSLPIGFHAIPNDGDGRPLQSEEQLGEFYSAGCVRQSPGHAAALYAWANLKTKVVVLR